MDDFSVNVSPGKYWDISVFSCKLRLILYKLLSVLGVDKPKLLSRGLQIAVIHRVYLHYKAGSEANIRVHGVRMLVLSVTLNSTTARMYGQV